MWLAVWGFGLCLGFAAGFVWGTHFGVQQEQERHRAWLRKKQRMDRNVYS